MKIKTFTLFDKSKTSQYRLCEILPTVCGVNGLSYFPDQQPILTQPQCTCSIRKFNISAQKKWTQQDRIRSYSQIIQRPSTKKSTRIPTQTNSSTPPKFLQLRVSARRWCVMQGGKKLYASNETVKCEAGCLTKLMAVYIILNLADNISGKIMVPAFVENLPSPNADLNSYNYLTLDDLLHALILRGANDALWTILYCIAERLYGITQRNLIKNKFLSMFNSYAQSLNMINTRYTNLEGLDDPNNVTTAQDICLLFNQLLKFDLFIKILKTKSYTCRATYETGMLSTHYSWKNRQLGLIKKGYSGMNGNNNNSGLCSAILHEEDNRQTIMVLLKCNPKSQTNDAQMIINNK